MIYFWSTLSWLFEKELFSVFLTSSSYTEESEKSVNMTVALLIGGLICWLIYLAYLNFYLKPVSEKKTFIVVGKNIYTSRSEEGFSSDFYYLIIGNDQKIRVSRSTYLSKGYGDMVDVMEHRYLDKEGNVKKTSYLYFYEGEEEDFDYSES